MPTVHARQRDTLDVICWRELGSTRGMVEAVFELNRGLAELGPFLPVGTPVRLPERRAAEAPDLPLIHLWD